MPQNRKDKDLKDEAPELAETDWENLETSVPDAESIPENGDIRYPQEPTGELPGEDDDNPYQESDEALPEDADERVLRRHPDKQGGRFDQL